MNMTKTTSPPTASSRTALYSISIPGRHAAVIRHRDNARLITPVLDSCRIDTVGANNVASTANPG